MSRAIDKLTDHITSLRLKSVPGEVVDKTKAVIIDTIGVILGARKYPHLAGNVMAEFIRSQGGVPQASVLGSDLMTTAINAAFVNGTLSHDIELDDNHNAGTLHTGAVVVPAALAVAEMEGASGRELMTAVLLAYDVECRISMALTSTRQYQRSFHPSSVCGTFGAMTAAGRLMGLDKPQLTNAFGLAGCQASGLQAWATEMEHFTKSFQTGIAARNGVTAAILARDGYQGPPDILEGRHNVFDAFSGVRNFQELTRGLGEEYEIMMTSLKQYSACRFLHAPLDALLDILAANDLEVDNIDTITAEVCEYGKPQIDRNELITHNAQYVLAAAAYRRRLGMDEYSTECRNDPRIRDLASRVYVEGNSELEQLYPERWAAIVHVKMKDGREFSKRVDFAKGDPQNPMTWEEVVSKFVSLAGPVISEAKAEAVVELVSGLETLDDTRELVKLLRLG